MYRCVKVLFYGEEVGELTQSGDNFIFRYCVNYAGPPLSLSLPVQQREFISHGLHPYFASLAPEGWLRQRYSQLQKRDQYDQMGMLIENGKNLLGAVQILPMEE